MNNHIASKIMRLLNRRELKEKLAKVARILSCIAVFCITYILVAPVLTEEWPAVCGMEEHVHDDSCYIEELVTPEPELICGLEETGHVHTGSCYTAVRGDLMCTETGTEEAPHEHTDECYAWSYELTCTESEEGHIHTEACWAPAGEPSVQKVLICTLPEHTHTDACYHVPEENPSPEYICGNLTEHIHTDECFFEDGSLKCTVPEHTHTEACVAVELPALSENEELAPVDEQFTYENEEVTVVFTVQGEIPVAVAEPAENSEAAESAEAAVEAEPVETTEPVETAEAAVPVLELVVTESEDTDVYSEYEELATEDGDVMLMQVLEYGLTLDGEPVDLSRCEVTAAVTPKPELQQMMDAPQPLMTYAAENETGETEMFMELTTYSEENGSLAYAVVGGANPHFTVEYYAYLERVTTANGTEGIKLPVINTEGNRNGTGGNLPKNGVDPATTNLYLNENKQITTVKTLTEIYAAEKFEYVNAPGLRYINIILTNQQSNYELKEIWTRQSDNEEWLSHTYDADNTRITNRPQTAEADPNFILITDGTQLRMVYEPDREEERVDTSFYDYDITDGKIYASEANARNKTDGKEVTTQTNAVAYANVKKQGINGHEKVLAFGNSNVPTGLGTATWNQHGVTNTPNKSNKMGYSGCTFGLVQDSLAGKAIQYNISAPALFNEEKVAGKEKVDDRKLGFNRVGDTWTLSSVYQNGVTAPIVSNLEQFKERDKWGGGKMYGNNFWPLDSLAGTQGHDLKFGDSATIAGTNENMSGRRKAVGVNNDNTSQNLTANFPTTDFNGDHNAYFGMQFGVEFSLTNSYIGPLEYYFFGDDDMWVYLVDTETNTSKLICDIGGVHSAVGEYVNLWDYIDKSDFYELDESGKLVEKKGEPKLDEKNNPMVDKDGKPLYKDYIKKYELRFFYTERGASGSTCWMQFTLPTVVGLDLEEYLNQKVTEETGALRIQKVLDGVENTQDFTFKLTMKNENGVVLPDNYLVRTANGELLEGADVQGSISGNDTFTLKGDDVMVIYNLPEGTQYSIEEITSEGYSTTIYKTDKDAEETITGRVVSGTVSANHTSKVIYTNHATYELPATGGSGTVLWYTVGGLLVLLGLGLLTSHRKQQRGNAIS